MTQHWDSHLQGTFQFSMGSHHHEAAILVPDDKLNCFGQLENFFAWSKVVQLFYLGPVLPSITDGSSLSWHLLGGHGNWQLEPFLRLGNLFMKVEVAKLAKTTSCGMHKKIKTSGNNLEQFMVHHSELPWQPSKFRLIWLKLSFYLVKASMK